MTVSFSDYLLAKYALDERSLNSEVRSIFLAALRGFSAPRILDLGAGNGAGLRRLLEAPLFGDLEITALDRDLELLKESLGRASSLLEGLGYSCQHIDGAILGVLDGRRVKYQVFHGDVMDDVPFESGAYDAILAHSLMDLLPPEFMARRIMAWLSPRGIFYATLVYDGLTTFLPYQGEDAFERGLLQCYDQSMYRSFSGLKTAGPLSGRALHAALIAEGLEISALGASDWTLAPVMGAYRSEDRVCLEALLDMVEEEGARSLALDPLLLSAWGRNRREMLSKGQLSLVIHQLDLVGYKPPSAA